VSAALRRVPLDRLGACNTRGRRRDARSSKQRTHGPVIGNCACRGLHVPGAVVNTVGGTGYAALTRPSDVHVPCVVAEPPLRDEPHWDP
jgi:hypothetical protein